jgi:hypothetical protein
MSPVTAIRTESPRISVSEYVKFQRASGERGAHTDGMKGRNDAEIFRHKHIQGCRRAGSVEASDRCSVSVEECQGCGQSGESMGASKKARLPRRRPRQTRKRISTNVKQFCADRRRRFGWFREWSAPRRHRTVRSGTTGKGDEDESI